MLTRLNKQKRHGEGAGMRNARGCAMKRDTPLIGLIQWDLALFVG